MHAMEGREKMSFHVNRNNALLQIENSQRPPVPFRIIDSARHISALLTAVHRMHLPTTICSFPSL